jgi:hypothetical protein
MIPYQIVFNHGLPWTLLTLCLYNIAIFVALRWLCNLYFEYINLDYDPHYTNLTQKMHINAAFDKVRRYFIVLWIIIIGFSIGYETIKLLSRGL